MALQRIPGCNNQWLASPPNISTVLAFTSITLDAAADRITMIGRFCHQDGVSKTVDGVEFLLGAVTKAAGSTLQVSLQNVDLVNGPVMREDGTPDQTLTIANADAGFVTNAWYGGDFGGAATRSLAVGELVAVVFQFASFVATDTVAIRCLGIASSAILDNQNGVVANLSGTYALQNVLANVVFRCSDGTFGTLENAWPTSAINEHAFNIANATADEWALGVQLPFPFVSDLLWYDALRNTTADASEYLLTDAGGALRTLTVDHNALGVANVARFLGISYPPQTHAANTLYRISARPTTSFGLTTYSTDVNEVGHMSCLPGGTLFHTWSRVDAGSWNLEYTTRRLIAGIRLSAFSDVTQEELDIALRASHMWVGTK